MYRSNIIYIDTLQFNGVSCMESVMEEQTTDLNRYCYLGERKIMSDLISRKDAIELCAEAQGRASTKSELKGISKVWQGLIKLPSAEAEWIPCSERLPDAEYGEGDSMLCCTESGLMYILYWNGGNWCASTGEPYHWVNHKTGWHDKVIAWMPLPKPYREDGEA